MSFNGVRAWVAGQKAFVDRLGYVQEQERDRMLDLVATLGFKISKDSNDESKL